MVGRVVDPGSAVPELAFGCRARTVRCLVRTRADAGSVVAGGALAGLAAGCATPVVGGEPGAGADGAVSAVATFRAWLAGVDAAGLSDRERVELVAELERVKGAASAAQARATDALRCSRETIAPQDARRSVGSVVALARRESPTLGDRFVGLSRALVHEMPRTMAALTEGGVSERVAVAVVAATATLSVEDRAEVDARLGPLLTRLGVKQAGAAAARVAAELDAASVVARMEAAVKSRRVTVRPAPDGMAYLTVLGPLKDVVGAHAAVQARARGVVGGQCPDEHPEGRGVGAVAADTALRLLSGRATGQLTPVEVHLVMTDRALLGTGDAKRSVFEPARIPGHGSVPAPVARAWLREGLTQLPRPPPTASWGDPQPRPTPQPGRTRSAPGAAAADPAGGRWRDARLLGCGCGGCTRPRTGGTWSRWTRGVGCSAGCCVGCWCCVMTCAPPRGVRRRSCTPTMPPRCVSTVRPRSRKATASAPAATTARKPPAGAPAWSSPAARPGSGDGQRQTDERPSVRGRPAGDRRRRCRDPAAGSRARGGWCR